MDEGKPKLLLIEDLDNDYQKLRESFEDLADIFWAKTGQEALEMARKIKPEVIVSDVVLDQHLDLQQEHIDGTMVARQIRNGSDLPTTKIWIITSHYSDYSGFIDTLAERGVIEAGYEKTEEGYSALVDDVRGYLRSM